MKSNGHRPAGARHRAALGYGADDRRHLAAGIPLLGSTPNPLAPSICPTNQLFVAAST
jgi:hypothetical protein